MCDDQYTKDVFRPGPVLSWSVCLWAAFWLHPTVHLFNQCGRFTVILKQLYSYRLGVIIAVCWHLEGYDRNTSQWIHVLRCCPRGVVTVPPFVPGCPGVIAMRMLILWLFVVFRSHFYRTLECCIPSKSRACRQHHSCIRYQNPCKRYGMINLTKKLNTGFRILLPTVCLFVSFSCDSFDSVFSVNVSFNPTCSSLRMRVARTALSSPQRIPPHLLSWQLFKESI